MNKSVISLLFSNFLLLLNVIFFNTNILTVILIYACELIAVVVLQISKVLYLNYTGKQTILDSFFIKGISKSSSKSCIYIFVFGIIIFIITEGIGTAFSLINYLFQILNYKVEVNVLVTFTVIFTLSHLVSLKVNFINKLSQENITPKTSDQQDSQNGAAIINFAKIMNRIRTLTVVTVLSIIFVGLSSGFGLSNYINYYIGIIYCLIKTYYDYNSHIMEHNFKEKFGLKTNLE